MIEKKALELLQFPQIVEQIKQFCFSDEAADLCGNIQPTKELDLVYPILKQSFELKNLIGSGQYFPSIDHDPISEELKVLALESAVLEEQSLLAIAKTLGVAETCIRFLKGKTEELPALSNLTKGQLSNDVSIRSITQIVDEEGTVKSSASHELGTIRAELADKRKESDRRFYQAVSAFRKLGLLRENEEGYFNGRRTLAVMSEFKSQVSGFVHSKSESGRTIFIEPASTVQLNNEIVELELDEQREVRRILKVLCAQIRPQIQSLHTAYELLVQIDAIKARACYAISIDATLPNISPAFELRLVNAVHPLLFLQNKKAGKTTVPLNMVLDENDRVMLISGPNAGGKSIALKTVGLLQLMLHSGLLVPVHESSTMPFFDSVLVDIGDTQSIENELSTYSARLISMTSIVAAANQGTLVLMDEFGSGTDPELGSAIAEAVLESLVNSKTRAIITSHYGNVKILAEELQGSFNASMLFDLEKMEPRFVLAVGKPGSSYTFEVAERIGFPKYLIERAKSRLSRDKVKLNALLTEVQNEKTRLEEELRRKEHETFLAKLSKEKYHALFKTWEERQEKEREEKSQLRHQAQLGQKYLQLMESWKNKENRKLVIKRFVDGLTAEIKKAEAFQRSRKLEKLNEKRVEKLKSRLKVGSRVRVLNGKEVGVVEEILSGKAILNFGTLKMTAGLESLILVEEKT